jgi:molybdate transport system substrate-binding protein
MDRRSFARLLCAACVGVARLARAADDEVLVFAAASLTDALQEVGRGFETRRQVRLTFSFAGSNDLARQIRAGAPADVFVSANVERMDEVQRAGLVRPSDRVDLLSNRLVVVVPSASGADVRTPADLTRVGRIALGDPEAVPAGIYARDWLRRAGLWDALRDRVVPTLDVRAALAAVGSGDVDAAVVYRTDAAVSRRVRVAFEVRREDAPRIVYPAALLAASRGPAARAFLEYLLSGEARVVFERAGFEFVAGR